MEQDFKKVNKQLANGVFLTMLNRIISTGIQFVALIVLARFLTPDDFALMGIVLFFITISQTFVDSGMGGSLLSKDKINDIDYSTLLIYNVVVSVIICILLYVMSYPIATYYNTPELYHIIRFVGLSVVIGSFGIIQKILLFHQLKFGVITIISLLSGVLSLVVAIVLAIMGYGVWALVIHNFLNITLTVIFQFCYNQYFPSIKFSVESFREQWSFGSYLLYTNLLRNMYGNVFSLVFPKISTFQFSGLYTQANKVKEVPINIINSTVQNSAFPILSKIEDPEELKKFSRPFARQSYIVSFFAIIGVAIFSKQLLGLFLGDVWVAAAPILSIISIQSIFFMVSIMVRNIFKSTGKTKYILLIEIINSGSGLLTLLVTCAGGDSAVLIGIVASQVISTIIATWILSKKSNQTLLEQWSDVFFSILPFLPSIIIVLLFTSYVQLGDLWVLLIGGLIYTTITIISGISLKNREIIELLNKLINIAKRS